LLENLARIELSLESLADVLGPGAIWFPTVQAATDAATAANPTSAG
jgi:hypothetical protein